MPFREVSKLNGALETLKQIRDVNSLIQGLCARMSGGELTESDAEGLYIMLEWQDKQMVQAEVIIKAVYSNQAALIQVA
jgi:hypothetical protein